MPEPSKDANSSDLRAFREAFAAELPDLTVFEALLPLLKEGNLLEQALQELKRRHPRRGGEDPWQAVRARLEVEVGRARERRMNQWQLDPRRRSLRLSMEVRHPACRLHPPALQAVLAQAVLDAGLPLAMGLEKSPRPMVRLGHPLPLGVEGLEEWADLVLRESPGLPLDRLVDRINVHCPEGLRLLQAEGIPNHASPVLELCREARWAWICPADLLSRAKERLDGFAQAESYEIEKAGKVAGHKQVKRLEVRHLVTWMEWDGATFRFTTRLSAGEALNPVKLLAGVLGLEPAAIAGLARLSVSLGTDPRLLAAEKYEPKLHNIFEDAVLLESGSNVRIIDEDEDEPTLLTRTPPGA